MVKLRKTNTLLVDLIHRLRKEKKPFWKKVAEMLARPRTRKIEVNISKLERYGKEGTTVVIPGKVLGDGQLTKKMTIAAFKFSNSAKKSIAECGGKAITINDLVESKVEPKEVLLLS